MHGLLSCARSAVTVHFPLFAGPPVAWRGHPSCAQINEGVCAQPHLRHSLHRLATQVLLRALPGWAEVEADAMAFLSVAEERLLLALEPPAATPAQPLTAAMLQARAGNPQSLIVKGMIQVG